MRLAWYEQLIAATIGSTRRLETQRRGIQPTGRPGNWQDDIEGAAAEMAVAKHYDIYWSGSVNSFEKPDLPRLHVRSVDGSHKCLIVREADRKHDPSEYFVLVQGRCPDYEIVGAIRCGEVFRDEWVKNPATDFGDLKPAWFVPRSALGPLPTRSFLREAA